MTRDPHRDLDRLHDDLAGYVLGALDDAEASALARHLEDCDSCRERLHWLRPAVDVLPASVEQVEPPATLRANLLATVREEAEGAGADAPVAAPRRRRSWRQGLGGLIARPATGLALVALLVIGATGGYLLRGDDDEPASGFVSAQTAPGVQGSATLERHGDSATLHVNQLPPLDRDQVYEVWVQRAGVEEPASTFILGEDGSAEAAVPGPLEGADSVLVTAEPHPGSRRPTSPAVLEAPLE